MPFWNASTSTTLANDQMYVNNTYKDANGNNKLTTITATNKTGYRDIVEGSTQKIGDNPPGLKGLSYAIQNDGKITYKYDDGNGNIIQYNSIQEIANGGIVGFNEATTARIKDSMQKNLKTAVDNYNAANPDKKIVPTVTVAETVEESLAKPTNLVNINVGKANARTKYEDYYYPETLKGESDNKFKQDRIKFTMKLSTGTNINTKFGDQSFKRRDTGTIQGSVTLPIQPSITDSNSVDWQGSNLNAVGAYAAGASLSLMGSKDLTENVGKILGEISKELKNNNQTYSDALKVYLAQEAVGLQGLLSRTSGAILNPNMELLFNAPSLRPFTFTFRLSPRSISEAKQVKNIIRFFKQGMSVKTTETSVFLKAPNVFDIRYISYDSNGKEIKDHPSLNRIKTCALTGCDVNYTPDGTYMTFNDAERTMTSYELSLRFTELDPVYDSDYSDENGKAVSKTSDIRGFNPNSSAIGINEIGY